MDGKHVDGLGTEVALPVAGGTKCRFSRQKLWGAATVRPGAEAAEKSAQTNSCGDQS